LRLEPEKLRVTRGREKGMKSGGEGWWVG
jgi:hypothetical protein